MSETPHFSVHRTTIAHAPMLEQVAGWIQDNKDKMLPLSPLELLGIAVQGLSVLTLDDTRGLVASHAAVTYQWAPDFWEVGAVIANPAPEIRRHGAATKAVDALVHFLNAEFPDVTLFALVNNLSKGLFVGKLGWEPIPHVLLPEQVWDGCAKCSHKPHLEPGCLCCDTPVVPPSAKRRFQLT